MHQKALVTDYKLKVKGTDNIYAIGYSFYAQEKY
jgi:NADH dehydrogenase FAD-containing subunit